ncbi:thiamine pyrophosphate-dependent enzyme [Streptomyces sp. NPDC091377]|uniref:thiamine pyrophosphate-dependent enzyme n=1 Tax=Streptomyces sp. NPDC091377 TaxID=3365995 RepID=UPI0038292684
MLMPTVRRFSDTGSRWTVEDPDTLADRIRAHARHMTSAAGRAAREAEGVGAGAEEDRRASAFLGAALSSAEQVAAIFTTARPGRDRLVCSPAHYVIGPYAAAVAVGLLDRSALTEYGTDGSPVEAIGSERSPVVDYTCGSPGQGLSAAAGYALADRIHGRDARTFTLMCEEETAEGQVWEAARFTADHGLCNVTVVLDAPSAPAAPTAGTTPDPLAAPWRSFGWRTAQVDGHDPTAVREALAAALRETDGPTAVICRTSPGRRPEDGRHAGDGRQPGDGHA